MSANFPRVPPINALFRACGDVSADDIRQVATEQLQGLVTECETIASLARREIAARKTVRGES